jgi:hypothetical protein
VVDDNFGRSGSCRARPPAAGEAPAAGGGGGVSTERMLPRDKPHPLGAAGRDSHQDTDRNSDQHFLWILLNAHPNHVPCAPARLFAHFGATSDVCDGGVVRADHHNAGEWSGSTQQYDL